MIIVVMGVAGAGKTTVGQRLARELGWPFHDADDLHSPASVDAMRRGIALTDAQRTPWLAALAMLVADHASRGVPMVLAVSALRRAHRDALLHAAPGDVRVVYLRADPGLVAQRVTARTGHFFPASLVADQLAILEPPGTDEGVPVLAVDASLAPAAQVRTIREALGV